MRKIICLVLSLLIFTALTPSAKAESTIDQECSGAGSYEDVDLNLQIVQLFTILGPKTLDSVSFKLKASSDTPVKAKASFYEANPDDHLISEKYFSIQGTELKSYTINFGDIPLHDGVYAVIIKGLHENEHAYAVTTDGSCYPNGYAMILDGFRPDRDFLFAVKTISSENSSSIGSYPSSSTNNQSLSNINVNSTKTNKVNQPNSYSEQLANDKDMQLEIALILKDIEANQYRGGAFGLQGMVGHILTWPVFIVLCAFIFLFILLVVLVRLKTKKTSKVN